MKAAARRYLDKLDALSPAGVARVVDKMPDNVNHLGLIALLFPNAKVIICRRDPRDIAISCWQIGFRSCPWNNDWDHIARRLADYQRILAHWERVRPLPCLDLIYEDMVADLEHHARLLIDFVGLDWDPACLEFHSNPRAVRTPSLAQVRQPIHSRSSGRWRNYEPYVRPLFQAFERHGVVVPPRRLTCRSFRRIPPKMSAREFFDRVGQALRLFRGEVTVFRKHGARSREVEGPFPAGDDHRRHAVADQVGDGPRLRHEPVDPQQQGQARHGHLAGRLERGGQRDEPAASDGRRSLGRQQQHAENSKLLAQAQGNIGRLGDEDRRRREIDRGPIKVE